MLNHKDFIETSILGILRESISITNLTTNKIDFHPLVEYMLQSIFVKMCGFQEQKIRCIMWELANNNFNLRYVYLSGNNGSYPNTNSMYSAYNDKNKVYKLLIAQIKDITPEFQINKYFNTFKKTNNNSKNKVKEIIKNSSLYHFYGRKYKDFNSILEKNFTETHFSSDNNNLLNGELQIIYNVLYKNRNRIAHNTKSFQHNLPSLNSLRDENYKYENYFVWFALLVLIDDIFIELYKKYLETLDQRKFL